MTLVALPRVVRIVGLIAIVGSLAIVGVEAIVGLPRVVAKVAINRDKGRRRLPPGSPALSICSHLHLYSYEIRIISVATKVGRLPQAVLHYLLYATLNDFGAKLLAIGYKNSILFGVITHLEKSQKCPRLFSILYRELKNLGHFWDFPLKPLYPRL